MSFRARQKSEIQLSYESIHRLAHCDIFDRTDNTKWEIEVVPNNNFEIGVWEEVPVEPPRKKKSKRVQREPVDNDNIDYTSHLTPTIENMKKPIPTPGGKSIKNGISYVNIYRQKKPECLCYVCLFRLNINTQLPKQIVTATKKVRTTKLIQVTNGTKRLFEKLIHAMKLHRVQRPIENPFDYGTVLKFFEENCRPEVVDIAILLNDQLIKIDKDEDLKKMKKLHEVFKSLVYASVCKMFFKRLSDKVPQDKLKAKAILFIKDIKKFDPLRFLEMDPEDDSNIEKNFINLY